MGWPQMWHGLPCDLSQDLSLRLADPLAFLGLPAISHSLSALKMRMGPAVNLGPTHQLAPLGTLSISKSRRSKSAKSY